MDDIKEVSGKIEAVEKKTGKTGEFYSVRVGGRTYNYRPEPDGVDKSNQLILGVDIKGTYKESTYQTSFGTSTSRWFVDFTVTTPINEIYARKAQAEKDAEAFMPAKEPADREKIRIETKDRMLESLQDAIDIYKHVEDIDASGEDIQKIAVTLYLDRMRKWEK